VSPNGLDEILYIWDGNDLEELQELLNINDLNDHESDGTIELLNIFANNYILNIKSIQKEKNKNKKKISLSRMQKLIYYYSRITFTN
jgi:hypothetical protein